MRASKVHPTRSICCFIAVFVLGVGGALGVERWVEGTAKVIDGDSLWVGRHEVRLHGLDAPEWDAHCHMGARREATGLASTQFVQRLVRRKGEVRCLAVEYDRYGRLVAQCFFVRGGEDLAELIVEAGHGRAYRRYSRRYVAAEERARRALKGVHRCKGS